MKLRKRLIVAASIVSSALVFTSAPAYAVQFTTLSYEEGDFNFTWKFRWDGVGVSGSVSIPLDPATGAFGAKWEPSFQFEGPSLQFVAGRQFVRAFHDEKPPGPEHVNDGPRGDDFSMTISLATLAEVGIPTPIFENVAVEHPGMGHQDVYTLKYTGGPFKETDLEFTGQHVVPEPATLLLFGTTAAGLGLASRWRRRRQKQQPQV
jgi:hypothetical protein